MSEQIPRYKTASVADLIPYARNSRTHSDAQVSKIAASIRKYPRVWLPEPGHHRRRERHHCRAWPHHGCPEARD